MRYYIGLRLESLDAWGHGVLHCVFFVSLPMGFKRTIQCSGFRVCESFSISPPIALASSAAKVCLE